jgi:hypothetical protein
LGVVLFDGRSDWVGFLEMLPVSKYEVSENEINGISTMLITIQMAT